MKKLGYVSRIFIAVTTAALLATPARSQRLDETWTVTANGQSVQADRGGNFRIANIAAPDVFGVGGPGTSPDFLSDDFIRVVAVSKTTGTTRYALSEPFQIRRGQTFTVGQITFTTNPPVFPEALRVVASNPTLTSLGQTAQLRVTGILADGSELDLTPRSRWTVYRTSNPNIVTVDGDGLVTARGAGGVYITAVNEGATAVTRIFVLPGDPLTTVEGFVQLEDGTPVNGAAISIFALPQTSMSGPDGRFIIANVPSRATSNLTVRARATINGTNFVGTSIEVAPVPGGLTDAGVITLRQGGGQFGPIIVSGMDPEDHGAPGRDMIRDLLRFVVENSVLHPTPSNIVMFGGSAAVGTTARSLVTGFGFTLTQVTGSGITAANLNPLTTPHDAIYMPTTIDEISGGLNQADLNLINARSADIVNFINRGGGLRRSRRTSVVDTPGSRSAAWSPLRTSIARGLKSRRRVCSSSAPLPRPWSRSTRRSLGRPASSACRCWPGSRSRRIVRSLSAAWRTFPVVQHSPPSQLRLRTMRFPSSNPPLPNSPTAECK